jgi:ubiquinone/menaquinone biosynthesis C-methylase UbiE
VARRIQTAEHFERKPMSWWKREAVPERYEFLLTFLQDVKPATVLEIGSGRGAFAFAIRDLGMHVYGIEINRAFIEYCRGKDDSADVEFIQGNAETLPFRDECFDAMIGIEVLMHVPNPSILFSEISRVLKGGGHAVISYLKKYTGDYFKKMAMRFSGLYALKYGKHAFDYRYDTFDDIAKYTQGTNLVIKETHNEEFGNPCLILRKSRA